VDVAEVEGCTIGDDAVRESGGGADDQVVLGEIPRFHGSRKEGEIVVMIEAEEGGPLLERAGLHSFLGEPVTQYLLVVEKGVDGSVWKMVCQDTQDALCTALHGEELMDEGDAHRPHNSVGVVLEARGLVRFSFDARLAPHSHHEHASTSH
jgi:hypothetical protein